MSRARCLALALALASLAGCSDDSYGHLELEVTTASTPQTEVTSSRITLPVGTAVGVEARAYEADGDPIEGTLRLESETPTVLGVTPSPDDGTFVVFGRAVGQGTVRVLVNGSRVDTIDVVVIAQPD